MKHPFLKFQFKKPKKSNYKPKQYVTRLRHLLTNNHHLLEEKYQLELWGSVDMVLGLEYHYKHFVKIENACRDHCKRTFEYGVSSKNAIHEMVAYMNRLGQAFYFLKSRWFRDYIKEKDLARLCPVFLALLPFRKKFASHRSIDDTRGETEDQIANHASLPYGICWFGPASLNRDFKTKNIVYKIKLSKEHRAKELQDNCPDAINEIEIFSESIIWITFIPTKHHHIICNEIIRVIEAFINKVNQSL